ncbi:hypothetical protein GCM10027176_08860 [Actinoallomurus bryophytorum]
MGVGLPDVQAQTERLETVTDRHMRASDHGSTCSTVEQRHVVASPRKDPRAKPSAGGADRGDHGVRVVVGVRCIGPVIRLAGTVA